LRYWLVIPAAGIGQRLGAPLPKQYLDVHGRSLLEWSLAAFDSDRRCDGLVVALAPGDPWWPALRARLNRPVIEATGGAERADSVRLALETLAGRVEGDPWVLVHDAARPCVSRAEIDALLDGVATHPDGGLLALPLADTLKRQADGASPATVGRTEPRAGLWRALTPQVFRLRRLLEALRAAARAGRAPTDEAEANEWAGQGRPLLVPGTAANIKVTTAADLELVATILGARVAAPAAAQVNSPATTRAADPADLHPPTSGGSP
jgi:2-C-methyl-D-erythritol 4-phosphate cytidylyltransferase